MAIATTIALVIMGATVSAATRETIASQLALLFKTDETEGYRPAQSIEGGTD